jgi:hypothetical protein
MAFVMMVIALVCALLSVEKGHEDEGLKIGKRSEKSD